MSRTTTERLLIVGAGGLGREVCQYIEHIQVHQPELSIVGFLDDNAATLDGFELPYRVIGSIAQHQVSQDFTYVFAIGDPATRLKITDQLGPSIKTRTLIHPTALVASSAKLESGVIVSPFCFVGPSAVLGKFVVLNVRATVGHDSRLGDYATLSPHAVTGGFSRVGAGCFLSTSAIVNPGKQLGDWSKVSSASFVDRDLPSGSLVASARPQSRVMFSIPAAANHAAQPSSTNPSTP